MTPERELWQLNVASGALAQPRSPRRPSKSICAEDEHSDFGVKNYDQDITNERSHSKVRRHADVSCRGDSPQTQATDQTSTKALSTRSISSAAFSAKTLRTLFKKEIREVQELSTSARFFGFVSKSSVCGEFALIERTIDHSVVFWALLVGVWSVQLTCPFPLAALLLLLVSVNSKGQTTQFWSSQ